MQRKLLAAASLLLLPLSSYAAVVGNLKTEAGLWQTGIDGNAAGASVGPSVSYTQDRYFGAAGFMLGKYSNSDAQASFARNDLELSGGYRLLPLASVFGGIKVSYINYENSDLAFSYSDRIATFGGGAAVYYPIAPKLIALASASIDIPFSSYKSDSQTESGNGLGSSAEVGVSYRVEKKTNVNFRLKGQSSVLNYDASQTSWTTSMWKMGIDISHAFQ